MEENKNKKEEVKINTETKKFRKFNRTGEDIAMLKEREYYSKNNRFKRNICDTHEDGA